MKTVMITMKKMIVSCVMLVLSGFAPDVHAGAEDYTFGYWPNGWRKNANDRSADIFAIETSHYGFSLDVSDFKKARFGALRNPVGYEQAVENKTGKLTSLPPAELLVELEVDGVRYRAHTCKAGLDKGVKRLSSVRLWESGRYVQHYEFLGLDFRNPKGEPMACDASLDLVAWPGNLTLSLKVSADMDCSQSFLRLTLKNRDGTWTQKQEVAGPWKPDHPQSVSLTFPNRGSQRSSPAQIIVQTSKEKPIPVRFVRNKNCHVASVYRLPRSWKTGYTDIRNYDTFKISVRGSDSSDAIPFLLDMRPPANVTGVCPILCDEKGRPTGIPVQLSKNWHHKGMGNYVMAYTMLPAKKPTTYLLRFIYGFYGTLPSASHAQLSLVGYGKSSTNNGRWEQLAIGCWGETICFDMDMSCVDVSVTDIRMLMARAGLKGKKWGWTNAGWGGDWLNIGDSHQKKYFQNHLKTAYLAHGPCLTDVRHAGYYGANQEVGFSAHIQTLRTDDHARTFQKLHYTFTRDVNAKNIWLYKLGRTHHYQTPRFAYGDGGGVLRDLEVPTSLKKGHLFMDEVELSGPAPHWVSFVGASETAHDRNHPNGYRALIIRKYVVVADGKTYTNPVIRAPAHKTNPTNLDVELMPPMGVRHFRKGDRIELDLELITLPRHADDYYGPNEVFRDHLTANPNSWKTTFREAKGNDLQVKVSGGKLKQNYPLLIETTAPSLTVDIVGGVGVVPVRFDGLRSGVGNRLFQIVDGKRIPLDQSVHGHDYWQTDYDAATRTYRVSFNLPMDGIPQSRWILTQE